MSGADITFPSKVLPSPTVSKKAKPHVTALCKRLQNLRLAALSRQFTRKEALRDRHDRKRKPTSTTLPCKGDIVHRYTKTKAPKLTMQWTDTTWLVIKTGHNRMLLRSLTSPAGRKGEAPDEKWTNVKAIRVAGPTPIGFWIGARVRRKFRKT